MKFFPQHGNKIWCFNLTDCSNLSKFKENFEFFTFVDNHTKFACAMPPKENQVSV